VCPAVIIRLPLPDRMRNVGRILFAILFVVGAIGVAVTGTQMYTRLLVSSTILVVIAWFWARTSLNGLKITRNARSLKASVGDFLEENFEIVNTSRLPHLWIEVYNETQLPAATGSRVLTLLNGRQRRFYLSRSWITNRGAFKLGPTVLKSGDPFGLFRSQKIFTSADSLIVLPMIVDITSFPSPPGLLPGGKAIRRKSMDVTPHASGIREYAVGDPLKSIHWASTARRGTLMVKEFEQDPQAEIWLFLDTQSGSHSELPYKDNYQMPEGSLFNRKPQFALPPSSLEYGVTIAASLAHYFISQRRAVGFVSQGHTLTVISAERSERQESKILETLAFITDNGKLSIAGAVAAQARFLPLGSSVILLTSSTRPDALLAVDELQRRNLRPLVVLLMADSFGGFRGGEKLANSLLERSIPVCQICCGDDLAKVLHEFASMYISPDARPWQKNVFMP
jgi:uncharacterized protein (DUF58 family)